MEVIELTAQNELARFAPVLGCQCLEYRVGALEVISSTSQPDEIRAHPHRFGIPVLAPWPGRIDHAHFAFGGREIALTVNEPARGHAIHGVVCDREFSVVKHGPYFFQAELKWPARSTDLQAWPFKFTLRLDYEIGDGMRIRATAINDGPAAMPFGFGLHPYFNLPLDRRATRGAARLMLPAQQRWLLRDDLIPDGSLTPVKGKYDLRGGDPVGDRSFDDAFCGVAADADGYRRGRLIQPTMKIALEVSADSSFDNWLIYAPPDRGVLAIEPYTCAPDAFNLASRGIDAGLIEIAPGAAWTGTIEFKIVAA
jgi:aldose 1-epimerase